MLAIVAHHFVVNSGITDNYDYSNITANMLFLQLWGMWGKTAINCFVLITGYFMCTSRLTVKRFGKIYLEAKFYKILFFIIFLIAGYEVLSAKSLFKVIFTYAYGINNGFTSSFFAMYLFIPVMNKLIARFNKKEMLCMIALLLAMFTLCGTFMFNSTVFHHVFWYMTLYFAAAYIRLYPSRFTESKKFAGIVLLVSIILAYASVIVVDFVGTKFGFTDAYYMVSDSHKLLAFVIGVSAFLFFKNMKPRYNKAVNVIASTTFGVLLIHANGDAMRQWLWKDLLNVPSLYTSSFGMLVLYAIAIPVVVFIVCSLIDLVRIYLLEKPFFKLLEKHKNGINNIVGKVKSGCIKVAVKCKNLLLKLT